MSAIGIIILIITVFLLAALIASFVFLAMGFIFLAITAARAMRDRRTAI